MAKTKKIDSECVKFTKPQILRSKKFAKYRDIIEVCVSQGELITEEQLAIRIDDFMKGSVI